jgi:hypothetical protein
MRAQGLSFRDLSITLHRSELEIASKYLELVPLPGACTKDMLRSYHEGFISNLQLILISSNVALYIALGISYFLVRKCEDCCFTLDMVLHQFPTMGGVSHTSGKPIRASKVKDDCGKHESTPGPLAMGMEEEGKVSIM